MAEQANVNKVENVKVCKFEKIELPSKGKFYPKEWTENGKIGVRPMTIEEEMVLTTPRYIKKGIALDMVFKACLENKSIDTQELLSGDRSYLLYSLRCMSYGAAYDYEIKCPNCNHRIKDTYNLNNVKVKSVEDDQIEPFSFTLPISKKNIKFRFMRGKDELKLVQNREYRLNTFNADQVDNTLFERFSLVVEEYDSIVDKLKIDRELKGLIAGDAAALREKMVEVEPGVETIAQVVCPSCGEDSSVDVPLSTSFFTLSKTKK